MNKDQVQGNVDKAIGKTKEVVGRATGNVTTEAEGTIQKNSGKAREAYGDVKEKVKDAMK